jgi:hypothetical protein
VCVCVCVCVCVERKERRGTDDCDYRAPPRRRRGRPAVAI